MRLFTAAIPPPVVIAHLADALDGLPGDWVPRDSWHITLGYYGEQEPGPRVEWIREQAEGLVAPRVWLTDMTNFPRKTTLMMGVSAVDSSFAALGKALRWNDRHESWHPHLTVGHGEPMELAYQSPEWTIEEFVLLGAGRRYEYTVLERFSTLSQEPQHSAAREERDPL
jgi:RNA 2',3'-cyclic 3'-phosphodiesterase